MIKNFFWAGIVLVLIFLLPYLILGEKSYVPVHDNLDSNIVWYKVIAESDQIFASNLTEVSGIMGELPRLSFPSELNVITWLYKLFSPWTAFIINILFIRLVAFSSLFILLLELTIARRKINLALIFLFSLLFAFLSFWPSAGLSVAGQPLVLYLFLLLIKSKNIYWPYFLLFFYTVYSSLVLSGLFLGFALFFWFVIYSFKMRKINFHFLFGFGIFVLGYVISEYRLFLSLLDPGHFGFLSHREEMIPLFHTELFGNTVDYFLNGHYHSAKLPFILGTIILILTPFVFFKRRPKNKLLIIFLFSTYLCVIIASVSRWESISFIYDKVTFLKTFQLSRFFSLIPPLVFVTLFLLYQKFFLKNKILLSFGLLILLLGFADTVWMNMNIRNSFKDLVGLEVKDPTFEEFYSEGLFDKIKKQIPEKDSKFLSFGIHPAVLQYNNLKTADGYMPNYPLEKKHEFLNFLGKEWKIENPKNFNYIQNWGSRLYLLNDKFAKQVRYKWSNQIDDEIVLKVNWNLIKASGIQYLLSSNPILDEEISLVEIFEDSASAWKIFVYRII